MPPADKLLALKTEVLEANLDLVKAGLVLFTFGNASGIDRDTNQIVIKPSGVDYDKLKPEHMVVCSLDGKVEPGSLKPSSDLDTHLHLYREFPPFGTTHADYFHGPVPVTEELTDDEINGDYVLNTGYAITRRFQGLDPLAIPSVLVRGHAPFCWGRTAHEAAHNAIVLENVAQMAYQTVLLNAAEKGVSQALLDRHHFRKHGPKATYGQA
jgi:L-ribulose-5-phosphate 4-epimerase